ncbi:MAG: peroxiredoxin [Thermodesulfobacteriota bacterium]
MRKIIRVGIVGLVILAWGSPGFGLSDVFKDTVFNPGILKPVDSVLKVKAGDPAPEFELPSLSGKPVSLSRFKGVKNVVISFVPAAWTPVCSDQWPGYNISKELFEEHDAVLLGITTDNIPTLYSWTKQMGDLWFPVLSDFWPHGAVADRFGVLRSDGTADRAVIIIDKNQVIRYIHVSDINRRPDLGLLMQELEKLDKK